MRRKGAVKFEIMFVQYLFVVYYSIALFKYKGPFNVKARGQRPKLIGLNFRGFFLGCLAVHFQIARTSLELHRDHMAFNLKHFKLIGTSFEIFEYSMRILVFIIIPYYSDQLNNSSHNFFKENYMIHDSNVSNFIKSTSLTFDISFFNTFYGLV